MRRWKSERSVGLHDPQVNEHHLASTGLPADQRLRLLSFNIQVGISTERYRHYLTRSWQHLLPHTGRSGNLQKIGDLLGDFDLVALQEADGGSLRIGGARLAVVTSLESKGLEYDGVLVVDPDRIVAESPGGVRSLYVALTRPTQRLVTLDPAGAPAGWRRSLG